SHTRRLGAVGSPGWKYASSRLTGPEYAGPGTGPRASARFSRAYGTRADGTTPGVGSVNAVSHVVPVASLVSSSPPEPLPPPVCFSWPGSSATRLFDLPLGGALGWPAIVSMSVLYVLLAVSAS